jgi:hypothetical protein
MFHQTASGGIIEVSYLVIRKSRYLTVVPRIDLLK